MKSSQRETGPAVHPVQQTGVHWPSVQNNAVALRPTGSQADSSRPAAPNQVLPSAFVATRVISLRMVSTERESFRPVGASPSSVSQTESQGYENPFRRRAAQQQPQQQQPPVMSQQQSQPVGQIHFDKKAALQADCSDIYRELMEYIPNLISTNKVVVLRMNYLRKRRFIPLLLPIHLNTLRTVHYVMSVLEITYSFLVDMRGCAGYARIRWSIVLIVGSLLWGEPRFIAPKLLFPFLCFRFFHCCILGNLELLLY